MSDLVPQDAIEIIVGAERHEALHIARMVSGEEVIYVLHSRSCLVTREELKIDLRECPYAKTTDKGLKLEDWKDCSDRAVVVRIVNQRLKPAPELSTEIKAVLG
ncbi:MULTISPECIES: hypothetical protein [unclassified Pseudoclavibacter]|uniref:hypothetical protein n=1 Tax=unclassified Pseudoclavibacter TaxID=2615177 RepID=UPI001BAD2296|nr:hypothetical protein [Pseudoclavibacter sp. Marseille-Q4354]MBS3177722.1 hypothetical protein [Pseudoclavibacter sp. Marseille-Q4354]